MVCDFHGALYRRIYRGVFHYLDFCLSNYDGPETCDIRQFRYRGDSYAMGPSGIARFARAARGVKNNRAETMVIFL